MNGKPHTFNGTEGVVGLRCLIEKVEQVFKTCKCAEEDKVMFAASTFEGRALTWWNENVHTLGLVNANRIPWTEFKTMMTTEYCPATEIQKMEQELWTLTLKGDDIEAYNNRFHELALMCPELVPTEKKKIERYTRGFPERIKGNMTSSKPATLHDAINMARKLLPLSLANAVFKIDFVTDPIGSFGCIIGMDLGCHTTECHRLVWERYVRIPLLNGEILEVQGERSEKDSGSLACIKADEKKLDDIELGGDHYLYGTNSVLSTMTTELSQYIFDQKDLNMARRWIKLLSDYDSADQIPPGRQLLVRCLGARKERLKPRRLILLDIQYTGAEGTKMYHDLRELYGSLEIGEDTMDLVHKVAMKAASGYDGDLGLVDRLTKSAILTFVMITYREAGKDLYQRDCSKTWCNTPKLGRSGIRVGVGVY
ncbi:putative reverse transcriptase domain-containing protein [Tanacetum coccineum]